MNVITGRVRADLQCDWISRDWLDFTGQTRKEALGFGAVETNHPNDIDGNFLEVITAIAEGRGFTIRYRLRNCSGIYVPVISRGEILYRQQSFAGFIVGTVLASDVHALLAPKSKSDWDSDDDFDPGSEFGLLE